MRYLLTILLCLPLQSATYYVSTTGDDNYTTTQAQDIATPWRTIRKGWDNLSPGDTLYIRDGTYQEPGLPTSSGWPARSGTSLESPTRMLGYPGEHPTWLVSSLSGTGIGAIHVTSGTFNNFVFGDFKIDLQLIGDTGVRYNCVRLEGDIGGITFTNIHFINNVSFHGIRSKGDYLPNMRVVSCVFSNLATKVISDNWPHPMYFSRWTGGIIESNTFVNCGALDTKTYALHAYSQASTNLIIRNNLITNVPSGIILYDHHDSKVYNNVIYSHNTLSGGGLNIRGSSGSFVQANKVYNNTLYQMHSSGTHGIWIGNNGAGQNVFVNNITWPGSNRIETNPSAFENYWTNNIQGGTSGNWDNQVVHGSIPFDPGFIDPPSNLQLRDDGSGWEAGWPLPEIVDVDFLGMSRPQDEFWDCGAYERSQVGDVTPPVKIEADGPYAHEVPVTPQTFTVTRQGTSGNLNVTFAVTGTAVAGEHYTALSSPVTISDGNSTAQLTVTPIFTGMDENKTVIVTLQAGTGYTVGTPSSATITIVRGPVATGPGNPQPGYSRTPVRQL